MNTQSSPTHPASIQSEKSSLSVSNRTHYRLTNEEWLEVSQELKLAELRVLFHLRTLDPFGDRALNLKVIDIAEATKLQKGTVSKALKVLSDKGFIDLEMVTVRIHVKKVPVRNQVSCRKPKRTIGNLNASQETLQHDRKPDCTRGNIEKLEPSPDIDSESPHTLQTNQTDPSLSQIPEVEREKFEKFCLKKIEELPKRPTLPKRWIEAHLKTLWDQFQIERSAAPVPDIDWSVHPLQNEYLAALNDEGLGWIGLCVDQAEKRRRRSFYEWAQQQGLY
ncbi:MULTISPECIES: MarR family transcriptional regulator [Leptolyngbya]|uniref:MarR family transcriptional regulator n=1 Tax=Leptolyngbya TaxID=47251 RepID=UPI001683F4D8|nr:helix-turn-helix domain-containing protein [Leptolyngbya sp. FACHB-1624]MBD1855500.1 MarR family transcriptional regulator [Leptolyngbya sp. FACHB-1624]